MKDVAQTTDTKQCYLIHQRHFYLDRGICKETVYTDITGQPVYRIKIGVSELPEARIRTLQAAQCDGLELLACAPGGFGLERELHARFDQYKINPPNNKCTRGFPREWFMLPVKIVLDLVLEFAARQKQTLDPSAAPPQPEKTKRQRKTKRKSSNISYLPSLPAFSPIPPIPPIPKFEIPQISAIKPIKPCITKSSFSTQTIGRKETSCSVKETIQDENNYTRERVTVTTIRRT